MPIPLTLPHKQRNKNKLCLSLTALQKMAPANTATKMFLMMPTFIKALSRLVRDGERGDDKKKRFTA